MFKKDYFEKIIKLEDQLKDLKHTKKVISTPMLLKQKNMKILNELNEKLAKLNGQTKNSVNNVFLD